MDHGKTKLSATSPDLPVISLDRFLPYRTARLATALSRRLAKFCERQFPRFRLQNGGSLSI